MLLQHFYLAAFCSLVGEIPTNTEAEDTGVERVVGCEEIFLVARSSVHVTHHHKEAGLAQLEVQVDVGQRITANLYVVAVGLYSILSK